MKKQNTIGQVFPNNKISCHAEKVLFSISTVEKIQGRDPEQKPLRTTTNLNNTPHPACGHLLPQGAKENKRGLLSPSSVLTGHLPPPGGSGLCIPLSMRERAECVRTGVRGKVKDEALNKGFFRAPLRSGFTLIELLVVVLIIGILAAVALPMYQKAVIKSQAMQGLTLIKSMAQASQMYYLEHGTYPLKFADLNISLPSSWNEKTAFYTYRATDPHSNGTWSAVFENDSSTPAMHIGMLKGKYQGAGFAYFVRGPLPLNLQPNKIYCTEMLIGTPFKLPAGSFCEKVMHGTLASPGGGGGRSYTLP